jgi:hypothetical protein
VEDVVLVVCWSPKGGSGTSVVTIGLAIVESRSDTPHGKRASTVIVDLAGDIPAILGMDDPLIGLAEWITEPTAFDIRALLIDHGNCLRVLPRGRASLPESRSGAWSRFLLELTDLSNSGCTVIVDAGRGPIPRPMEAVADHQYLVTRPCYLALRRAQFVHHTSKAAIVVTEPDRALRPSDVAKVLGLPIAATLEISADIARRVDAGIISSRPPAELIRALTPVVTRWRDS